MSAHVVKKVADLDFESPEVRQFIALLAQRKTVIDPTLATFNFIRQKDGEMAEVFSHLVEIALPRD